MLQQVRYVGRVAGGQVIYTDHIVPALQEGPTEVAAEKTGSARDHDPHRVAATT
jgi:hypothetical protein